MEASLQQGNRTLGNDTKIDLMIMTPCYGGKVDTSYTKSAVLLEAALTELGVTHDWHFGTNESLVQRARCEMLGKFMDESEARVGLWIDADIEYTPQNVASLWNLIAGGAEIAVGIYPMKKPNKDWYAAWVDGKLLKGDALEALMEPTPVDYAGTGFMMFTRGAIEKIMDWLELKSLAAQKIRGMIAIDALNQTAREVFDEMVEAMSAYYEKDDGKLIPAAFKCPIYNGGLESEDYHFCRVAREAGIEIMLEPSVRLVHWGQWAYGSYDKLKEGDEHL